MVLKAKANSSKPLQRLYGSPQKNKQALLSSYKISIKNGKIEKLESEDQNLVQKVKELTNVDAEASVIREMGIGLNEGAKLTGNLLEDEKVFNTAHVAFGNNEEMAGGKNRSKTHRDFLFYQPSRLKMVRQIF